MNPGNYRAEPRPGAGRKSKWIAGLLAFFVPGLGHFYLGQMFKGIAIMLVTSLNICAIVYAGMEIQNVLVIVPLSLLLPIVYFYSLFDAIQSTDAVNERRHPNFPPYPYPGPYPGPYSGWTPAGDGAPGTPAPSADPFVQTANRPEAPSAGPAAATDPGALRGGFDPRSQVPNPPHGAPVTGKAGFGGTQRGISTKGVILLAAGAVILLLVADIGWTDWLFESAGSITGAVLLIGAGIGLWIWESRGHHGRKG